MLIAPAWVLLLIHAPNFWIWFLVPGVLYVVSVVMRSRYWAKWCYGTTHVTDVVLLPSDVTHLVIQRPPNFRFSAGDYIYINIPAVAANEWHPFTISSAPEQEGNKI